MSLDTQSFLDALEQHELLVGKRLEEAVRLGDRGSDPRDLARELVRLGWLTHFQVNRLLQGRAAELVLGQYVLLEKLAEGGMGQVYRARHRRLDRLVALKTIHSSALENAGAVERFLREARALARLAHPNIVTVHDANEVGGTPFLILELIEGTDLAVQVQKEGPLPAYQACDYIRQAALGLQHVYEKGLIHRDVKPQNLLLTTQGVVKVADFGLAGWVADASGATRVSLTSEGTMLGTTDFMAPEQAQSPHEVDIRADLYSLGCTLYYLLAGQVPFPGGTLIDKLLRHQQAEPEPIERLRPDLPPGLPALVRRLMAKSPEDRFATPADVARALTALGPFPTTSTADHAKATVSDIVVGSTCVDTATPAPPVRPPRRRRTLVLSTAALAFVLVGLACWLLLGRAPPEQVSGTPAPSSSDSLVLPPIPAEERFDWQPEELVAVLGEYRLRHWDQVHALAFSADGRIVASGGGDSRVRLWNVADGRQRRAVEGHVGSIFAVALSADGRLGASCGEGARLWDAADGRLVHQLKGHPGVFHACAFNPTSTYLATGGADGAVRLWDTKTGREVDSRVTHTGPVTALAFSPEGKLVIWGSEDRTLRLWTVGQKEEPRSWKGHKAAVRALSFSPQGTRIASGDEDGAVLLWDVADGRPTLVGKHDGQVRGLAFSADGKTLASVGTDETIRLWDVATGKPGRILKGFARLNAVAFSPTDRHLLASAGDEQCIRLWDTSTGAERFPSRGHIGPVLALAFHPRGGSLVSGGSDGTLRVWELEPEMQGNVLVREEKLFTALAFNPAGSLLATAASYEEIQLWDTVGWKLRPDLSTEAVDHMTRSLTFSPDGSTLAIASRTPTVKLWDMAHKKIVARLGGHRTEVHCVAFSPDGQTLAAADGDWETDGDVKLWKWAAAEKVASLPGHGRSIRGLAYAPDGRSLAFGADSGRVRVWDLVANSFRGDEGSHRDAVAALAYAPDGSTLVSADVEGRVVHRDPANAQKQKEWKLPGGIESLAFHPGSRLLAVGCGNGMIYLFRLPHAAVSPS